MYLLCYVQFFGLVHKSLKSANFGLEDVYVTGQKPSTQNTMYVGSVLHSKVECVSLDTKSFAGSETHTVLIYLPPE